MNSRFGLLVAAIVLSAPSVVFAQEDAAAEDSKVWSGEVALGASMAQGNTEEAEINGSIKANRITDENEIKLRATADYASQDSEMITRRYFASGRYAYNFGDEDRWYNFYMLEGDHDRFANIDWRVTPSTGVGYHWKRKEDFKLQTEAGLGFQHTEFRDGTASRSDPVLVTKASLEKTLVKGAVFGQDFTFWPNLGDLSEYRFKSETTLTSPLTDSISLRLSLLDEYLSNPASGAENNDLRATSSLVYKY